MKDYQTLNSQIIDSWCESGWQWGQPISHQQYLDALAGNWGVYLTPTKTVPKEWFGDLQGKQLLGLASGGGQQLPIFSALGAQCTLLDYSSRQCESDRMVARREGYSIHIIQGDMTQPLPFADESFDLIFHPVSNCYVEKVEPIFLECYRILKKGGILLCGLDTGINYLFDEEERCLTYPLPFNPLQDPQLYEVSMKNDWGIQFSHTLEEQLGGQLKAEFYSDPRSKIKYISVLSLRPVFLPVGVFLLKYAWWVVSIEALDVIKIKYNRLKVIYT